MGQQKNAGFEMSDPEKTRTLLDDASEAAKTCGANQIRIAARQITRYLDARMRATAMPIEQFNLLTEIMAAQDDSLSGVAKSTSLDKSTLTRNLKALEKQGLIEIATGGTDSRRRLVSLTETGTEKLAQAMPIWRAANNSLSRFVDTELARTVADSSRKLPVKR